MLSGQAKHSMTSFFFHRLIWRSVLFSCVSFSAINARLDAQSAAPEKGSFAHVKIPRLNQAPTMQDFAEMQPASPLAKEMLRITNFIDRKSTRLNSSHLVISYAV